MERSHHLTAALYFGIATLEAFLNREMRSHLKESKSEEEIFDVLRRGRFINKLRKWPVEIIGAEPGIPQKNIDLIELCNDVRGDLTHPKTLGHDIYERLLEVRPDELVDAIAAYIVAFHAAQGTRYPYWIFGWNYLNPRPNIHEIILINDQQFCFSLQALGFDVPAAHWGRAEAWKDRYFKSLDGYQAIKEALSHIQGCEPKYDRFPFQPKLCQQWWSPEHHKTCGYVTAEALAVAEHIDKS